MKTTIAVLSKKNKPILPIVIDVLKNNIDGHSLNFTVASPEKILTHKSPDILNKQNIKSSTIIGCTFTKEAKKTYNFLQIEKSTILFEGTIYTPEIKENFVQETTRFVHNETQLQTFIEKTEGDYSLFKLKNQEINVIRDPLGVQPLYYGENKEIAAFASNRKTLWQLGIDKIWSFPPGNLCLLNKTGFQFKPIKTLTYAESKQILMKDATAELQKLLEQAVKKRVNGLEKVTVAFSGGLDSSLIAYIANKCGVKVDLVHVSLENEFEVEAAFEASEELGLPMKAYFFKESDVERVLSQVVNLIEEADPVKLAIGVPFYWTAMRTQEAGHSVLLAGQGADELFGGYHRYVKEYCTEGGVKVRQLMFNDIVKMYENNIERDKKICESLGVELRLPFCSFDLAEFAIGLPVELKFESKQDSLRKMVLRRVAANLGLPELIVNKPKKAIQYSTGINNAIKRIAQKNNQTVKEYVIELFQKYHQ